MLGTAAAGLLAACGRPATPSAGSGSAWSFTDDRGRAVTLDHGPIRIVAQSGAAAALWDLGVHAVGVFGPQRRKDGSVDPQIGDVDLGAVQSVGTTYGEFSVEKLAALRPDLLVSGMYLPPALWYVTDEVKDRVEALVKTVGVSQYRKTAVQVIERYVELGTALGADLRTVAAAKAAFETLSWEQAAKYPADLVLYDARTQSLTLDQLRSHPTWNALPAVRAGQITPWHAETPFSYTGFVPVLKELTAVIAKAHPLA